MVRLAVFSSHNGSNLQAIIDAAAVGRMPAAVALVISNNPDSFSLERARRAGIPAICLNSGMHGRLLGEKMLEALSAHGVDLVFLAGYLKKMPGKVMDAYSGRMFNIHPSLLPRHGGKGMHGLNVHRAVLAAGDAETGATVHSVSGDYDTGEVLAQTRVRVLAGDTPETLAKRVLAAEHALVVETLAEIARKMCAKANGK